MCPPEKYNPRMKNSWLKMSDMPTHLNAIILQGNMEINNYLFMLSPTSIQITITDTRRLARSYSFIFARISSCNS